MRCPVCLDARPLLVKGGLGSYPVTVGVNGPRLFLLRGLEETLGPRHQSATQSRPRCRRSERQRSSGPTVS